MSALAELIVSELARLDGGSGEVIGKAQPRAGDRLAEGLRKLAGDHRLRTADLLRSCASASLAARTGALEGLAAVEPELAARVAAAMAADGTPGGAEIAKRLRHAESGRFIPGHVTGPAGAPAGPERPSDTLARLARKYSGGTDPAAAAAARPCRRNDR